MTTTNLPQPRASRLLGLALSAVLVTAGLRAETTPPANAASASESKIARFAIGAEVGTAGYGPVIVLTASKHFTFDLGYTWFSYNYDYSDSDAEYKAKLKLSNLQAIANWHPFAGTFHLSAGGFLTDNKLDIVAKPKAGSTYDIGNTSYTAAQVGTLSGSAEISKGVAPFVGLGWSKAPTKSGFGFFFELGVLFIDDPSAELSATGPIANDATFKANLQKEVKDINDDLSGLKYYPIAQLGLMYRF